MDRETQVFHTRTRQGGIRAREKARIYANNLGSFFSRLDERKWLCFEKRSRASSREMFLFYIYIQTFAKFRGNFRGNPDPTAVDRISVSEWKIFNRNYFDKITRLGLPENLFTEEKKTPGEQSANSVIRAYWET